MSIRRCRGVSLVAGLVLITAVSTSCAEVTSGTPAATLSLAGLVRDGAESTLSQKSANLILSGKISAGSQSITLSGTGQTDMSTNAMKVTMRMRVSDQAISMTEIIVGGHFYLSVVAPGGSMKQLTGHDWAEIKVPGGIQTGGGSGLGDPLQMLKLATSEGATITSLGSSTIRGVKTNGYSVAISKSAYIASVTKRLQQANISASDRSALLKTLESVPAPTFAVWIDPGQKLLRRMSVQMTVPIGSGATGDVTFDFVNYGAKVSITAPPASDVETLPGTH